MAKKSTMKMLAMVLAFGIVISNLSVASFAKNDKHNEPETEAVTTNPDNDKTKFKSDEQLAFDKQDIVTISEKINTFETSILPYEDCCTIFVAKHPVTKPNLKSMHKSEELLQEKIGEMVQTALETREIIWAD